MSASWRLSVCVLFHLLKLRCFTVNALKVLTLLWDSYRLILLMWPLSTLGKAWADEKTHTEKQHERSALHHVCVNTLLLCVRGLWVCTVCVCVMCRHLFQEGPLCFLIESNELLHHHHLSRLSVSHLTITHTHTQMRHNRAAYYHSTQTVILVLDFIPYHSTLHTTHVLLTFNSRMWNSA